MAYIGTSPSNGVRRIYNYTATASQTSFSGNDTLGISLAYADGAYIDVYQNGVLLIPTDYVATTGTTVVLDTAASEDDTVQMVVYDVFSVADTVSQSAGGNFAGNVGMGGTLAVTGVPTFTGRSVHSGGITIANAGQIGSVGDADAMAISSSGVVTFSQTPVGAGVALTSATTVAATSGTEIIFTGIPSTTSRIMLMFRGVTMSANQNIRITLGTSSGLVTSGYIGTSGYGAGANNRTDSWVWYPANGTLSGVMTICHMGGNIYVQGHSSKYNTSNTSFGGGDVAVGGVVDRLGIDPAGDATFSAGAINIMFD
jgi:hypothetical protein|tara:strand:+ start:833 stop:1771 length:939 start_codon:yes stop_codon:yes gene_type:complete